ncbi:MAG: Gfo/Idh/MocA family oxidoreductase [Bacteroidaceae bacterium]|nr:Gfo/Idh/MocA family oxidoreductase [Bacteroidaceae bacterium]
MKRIGIICPSEIAFRRFLPALKEAGCFEYAGVAIANKEEFAGASDEILAKERSKAQSFKDNYGGKIFEGYRNLIESEETDAVYLPLPPGLHYKWAKAALDAGKHILVEKPCTTSLTDTQNLLKEAGTKYLAVHENYMFAFHDQLKAVNAIVDSGEIGDVRLYRISFGFPLRAQNDFRYNKDLGGGALLDCGGYTLKYASMLLGPTAKMTYAQSNNIVGFSVDMYGSAALVNDRGVTAQVAFGMDHNYKCELEVWGSKGTIYTNRILTAPAGYVPEVVIRKGNEEEKRSLPADDAFKKSILHFSSCIDDQTTRKENYQTLLRQAKLVEDFKIQASI